MTVSAPLKPRTSKHCETSPRALSADEVEEVVLRCCHCKAQVLGAKTDTQQGEPFVCLDAFYIPPSY
jgi:hypothetical protein